MHFKKVLSVRRKDRVNKSNMAITSKKLVKRMILSMKDHLPKVRMNMSRTILIIYEHFAGNNAHLKRGWWSGIFEDTKEGYDYGSKKFLKREAEKDGYSWKVIRSHRDGTTSITEQSRQQ